MCKIKTPIFQINRIVAVTIMILFPLFCFTQMVKKEIKVQVLFDNNFKIFVSNDENINNNLTTYTSFFLQHNNKIIFTDTTNKSEYDFSDTLYPMLFKIDKNSFELLVEINDRPNKNYLKRFYIKNDKIIKTDKLPTFICKGKKLNKAANLYFVGFWDHGEEWENEKNEMCTAYNPILYYSLTSNRLKLDTRLTIKKNFFIYGSFKGFNYDEKKPIKLKDLGNKFINEIKRVEEF